MPAAASVASVNPSTISNGTAGTVPIDCPESEEPAPETLGNHAEDSEVDPFPGVPEAPKPDPVQLAVNAQMAFFAQKYHQDYGRRKAKAELAIQYLNCQYAGSSPQRVEVMKAAEVALLDFLKAEIVPAPAS